MTYIDKKKTLEWHKFKLDYNWLLSNLNWYWLKQDDIIHFDPRVLGVGTWLLRGDTKLILFLALGIVFRNYQYRSNHE